MPDFISDTMNWMSSGSNALYIALPLVFIFIIYLIATRKPRPKEFKPLDLKKETRNRYNQEYGYFGHKLGLPIHEVNDEKPFGFIIGYMRVVWMEQIRKYEPVHQNFDKVTLFEKMSKCAQEVYQKPFADLDDVQKKSIRALARDELQKETVETIKGARPKIVQGRKETIEEKPIPCYMFKVTHNNFINKFLASISNIGTDYFVFDADQIDIENTKVNTLAHLQRKQENNIFVFSKAGKQIVQDVGFTVEREEFMGAVANSIQRVLFNNDMAKDINIKREDARISDEKYKHTKESNE